MPLARHLVGTRLLSEPELARAERYAADNGLSLVNAVRQLGLIDARGLAHAIATCHRLPLLAEVAWPRSLSFAGELSTAYLRANSLLPLAEAEDGTLVVAVGDPSNAKAIEALRLATGRPLQLGVAAADEIEAAIDQLGAPAEAEAPHQPGFTGEDVANLRDLALGAPVVKIVNQLLVEAVRTRASDIHIEPARNRLIVRMRTDGMLREVRPPPFELASAIVSRVKILSGLDIAERRLPQDGRARIRVEGRQLDLRIATVSTINGEAVAIRILENAQRTLDLAQLGYDVGKQELLRRHLAAPHGLILVTGPTGSGKTTTLAAALTILNEPTRKILTIEDPVEYRIDGINQVQVKPEIGVTFAHALRSFLRSDPDAIMVGELRDTETARVAVQAALTGHIVLSTLHTNSAPGAVTRLIDMGVDGYLVASCLRLVIAQRLVRTLCQGCRKPVTAPLPLPREAIVQAGLDPDRAIEHWSAVGCERCFGTGYVGRTGIVEIMQLDEETARLIRPEVTTAELAAAAARAGMRSMAADGVAKCAAGITTPDEVRRVAVDI